MNNDWNQKRLYDDYIATPIEENALLEYKAAGALAKSVGKKKEIAKDVSAIANSAGGIIIYGISEYQENDKKHLPEKFDPVNRTEYPKEWLDQIINYNIYPRIDGLLIHTVDLDSGPNDVAYVVEIPQSITAHQVITNNDYRYYERANFEVVRMPDHRIRDVMNRGIVPNATVYFYGEYSNNFYRLRVRVKNEGKKVIRYMKLKFSFPNLNNVPSANGFKDVVGEIVLNTELQYKSQKYEYHFYYYSNEVLFPEDEFDITDKISLEYRINEAPKTEKFLEWTLFADSMQPKKGKIPIYDLERN